MTFVLFECVNKFNRSRLNKSKTILLNKSRYDKYVNNNFCSIYHDVDDYEEIDSDYSYDYCSKYNEEY